MFPPLNRRYLPVRKARGAWKIKLKLSCRLTGDKQFQPSESEPVDVGRDPAFDLVSHQMLIAKSKFLRMDDDLDV